MSIGGTWQLDIKTPIGRQRAILDFTPTAQGWAGTARGSDGDTPLSDVVLTGEQLTWSQSITRPMRLNLEFHLTVTGDTMTGTSKAGRLPKSQVTGTRTPPTADQQNR